MNFLSISRSVLTQIAQSRRQFSISSVYFGKKDRLTPKSAVKMIKDMNQDERTLLMEALNQREDKKIGVTDTGQPPSWSDLNKLAFHQSIPFIGFGFLDNFIMIVAGEYIDSSIGASFCISTMAAAALGNTLSDVFGVGSAWYVEYWATRLGATPPELTLEQLELSSSRIAANGGKALGVAFGCVLGMFPLLFYAYEEPETEENEKNTPEEPREVKKPVN